MSHRPAIRDAGCIAFDFGGTLVRMSSAPSAAQIAAICASELNGAVPPGFAGRLQRGMAAAAHAYRAGSGDTKLHRIVADAAGPGRMTEPQIARCLAQAWRAQPPESLLPGVHDAVRALHAAGYRLVLASNTRQSPSARGEAMERLGLTPYFSAILASSAIGSAKPDPAFFGAVRVAARGRDVLFVGDSFRRDVMGAARAGLAAIWVAPTPRPRLRRSIGITDGVGRLPHLLKVAQ